LLAGASTGNRWVWALSFTGIIASAAWVTLRWTPSLAHIAGWGLSLAMALYLAVPLLHFVLLRDGRGGLMWAAWALGGAWINDTMAYATGRLFGRHKMIPRISPGKTWEGTVGGIAATAVVSAIAGPSLLAVSWPAAASLGLLIGVAGVLGDLFESFMKRSAGVKDSGALLPGHGGVLDRMDSLMFIVPLVFYSRQILGVNGWIGG
jgi:phosphatidate cytidylyltransferase